MDVFLIKNIIVLERKQLVFEWLLSCLFIGCDLFILDPLTQLFII